jgi:hypothetical protein
MAMKDEDWKGYVRELRRRWRRGEVAMCRGWLRNLLRPHALPVADVKSEVKEHLGLSAAVVERAGRALGVEEYVIDGTRWWSLPAAS